MLSRTLPCRRFLNVVSARGSELAQATGILNVGQSHWIVRHLSHHRCVLELSMLDLDSVFVISRSVPARQWRRGVYLALLFNLGKDEAPICDL